MKKNRSLEEIKQPKKMTSIGGQALMEGLMMIGPQNLAMAVRLPDGSIHVETAPIGKSSKAAKIPFIRGSVKIFRQMVTGTRYLMRSASFIEDDIKSEEGVSPQSEVINNPLLESAETINDDTSVIKSDSSDEISNETNIAETNIAETNIAETNIAETNFADANSNEENTANSSILIENSDKIINEDENKKKEKGPGKIEQFLMKNTELLLYLSATFGILLSVGLFILLPNLITNLSVGLIIDKNLNITNRIIYSLVEGVLRITIFVAYLALASKLKDIKRVWMYHGAEHKTIACYESGLPLTIANARSFSKHHPRCGTAFMFIILLISIIIFSFVPKINIFVDLLIRLACVPLLASLSYEVIHWAAKNDNKFTRALSWPGMMLQRLTTKEPDDDMLEVAIAAMIPVIPAGERGDEW